MTKQAFTYVFDRATGQPVWPIEERPVPQSDVPGEQTSPTQPFPTKPPAFDRQGVTLDDLIDFTPELKAEALELASQYQARSALHAADRRRYKRAEGLLMLPTVTGGANWQGGAVDPETGMLYVRSGTMVDPLGAACRIRRGRNRTTSSRDRARRLAARRAAGRACSVLRGCRW